MHKTINTLMNSPKFLIDSFDDTNNNDLILENYILNNKSEK